MPPNRGGVPAASELLIQDGVHVPVVARRQGDLHPEQRGPTVFKKKVGKGKANKQFRKTILQCKHHLSPVFESLALITRAPPDKVGAKGDGWA